VVCRLDRKVTDMQFTEVVNRLTGIAREQANQVLHLTAHAAQNVGNFRSSAPSSRPMVFVVGGV
jgi:hypothetical protein